MYNGWLVSHLFYGLSTQKGLIRRIKFHTIQFSISIAFVYTVKCQDSSISNNSVQHKYWVQLYLRTVLFSITTQIIIIIFFFFFFFFFFLHS